MSEVKLKGGNVYFESGIDKVLLNGQIGNLQIFDCTNYPNTIFLENEFDKMKKHEFLGLSGEKGSILKINFEKNLKKNELDIQVNEIKVDFFLQPFFRILDFIFIHILEFFNLREAKEKDYSIFSTEFLLKKIENSEFMSVFFKADAPLLLFRDSPYSKKYVLVNLGKIEIKNERKVNNQRIEKTHKHLKEIFCDIYEIWMKNMVIQIVNFDKYKDISLPFRLNIMIEMISFGEEYNFLYEECIENSIVFKARVLPIILNLEKKDYLLIMKIIYANLIYDDYLDNYFMTEFKSEEDDFIRKSSI